ncbi:plasma membrane calcium-transporting ATPase [Haematococcus lacustris]
MVDIKATVNVNINGGLEEEKNVPYGIKPSELNELNSAKDQDALNKLGGVAGLAKALHVDLIHGLASHEVAGHGEAYGVNTTPDKPSATFLQLLWDALHDPMIIILLIVAVITIVIGAAVPEQRAHQGWSEGLAVLGTAFIVVFIAAGQDWSKEQQFKKLNALKDVIEIKVTRDGKQMMVHNTSVVVGDLLFLDTGDKICADGLLVESQGIVIDEASLTGESDPIKKSAEHDPWCRSGTSVNEGSGHMLVTAVGPNSEWGKTMALVSEAGDDMTPLQEQLEDVATKISKAGVTVAIVCFFALLIKWLVETGGGDKDKINDNGPLQFLLYAITITVVSIPEGLPLAVTLTLAYSMKKMMRDNNFVRVLSACETMGGATAICSDKTGTLTENRMTVVEGWFSGTPLPSVPNPSELSATLLELLRANCAMNNKAFLIDQPGGATDFVGNRTECALLVLLRKLGIDYNVVREEMHSSQVKLFGFSSARKMASVLLRTGSGDYRLYNKGAAEWVLRRCTQLLGTDGTCQPMDAAKLEEMLATVTSMAKRGLRCICLSYRDLPQHDSQRSEDWLEDADALDNELIAYAIVGIKDPVRQEVPAAVATCQRAGITVRMVTGDNIHTAQHISRECGILEDGCLAMEGPVFRAMPAAELIPLLPRLRVLARSSPEDKLTLVSLLKKQGEVVAVTGDGTNDAPALKESDVGLAMGIAGTEVAKEAADIIILDDNFSSIVKSVLWGRCVYENIRKFLVFQLSVNLVAMISAVVGSLYGGVAPLNVLQLLWVNMIMDTLAALALATEEPYIELLDDKPHGRHEALISGTMYYHMFSAALYKLFWLFACLYALPVLFSDYALLKADPYYRAECPGILAGKGWNSTMTSTLCNLASYCGFPQGSDARDTILCDLHAAWTPRPVPLDAREAICIGVPANQGCPWHDALTRAQGQLSDEWDRELRASHKPSLSLLFNIFIMAQVANAFVSRRIGFELDFFKNITHSPIFLSIMVTITVLQVIIMQTPVNYVFKVQALTGQEWGISLAAGAGAIPWAWVCRLIGRFYVSALQDRSMLALLRGKRVAAAITQDGKANGLMRSVSGRNSGRGKTLSGRQSTAKSSSGRTASGPHSGKVTPVDTHKSPVAENVTRPKSPTAWA